MEEQYRFPPRRCQPRPRDLGIPDGESRGSRLSGIPSGSPGLDSRPGFRRGSRIALAFLTALGPWGCETPDSPARLPGPLPDGLLSALPVQEVRALSLGPGAAYFQLNAPDGPWAIHLLRVDLGLCDLGLAVVPAPRREDLPGGRSRVTALLETPGHRVVAAVNGDFFTPEGFPVGTEVVGGEVRRIRDRPAFAWRPGELPWMGVPVLEGDSLLVVGWRIPRKKVDGVSQVLGGFPHLLKGGMRVGDLSVVDNPSFAAARHPRTAVGFDPSRGHLWMVGVDGRRSGYSDGMTLPELTGLFEALGVTDAMNLDGGGSTVMVLDGVVVNRPSDAEGERPVVNALAVVRDPGFCRVRDSSR